MLKLYKSQKVNIKKSQIKTSCLNHNNNGTQIQKEQRQNKQKKMQQLNNYFSSNKNDEKIVKEKSRIKTIEKFTMIVIT